MGDAKNQEPGDAVYIDSKYFHPVKLSSWSLNKLDRRALVLLNDGWRVYRPLYIDWKLSYAIELLPKIEFPLDRTLGDKLRKIGS